MLTVFADQAIVAIEPMGPAFVPPSVDRDQLRGHQKTMAALTAQSTRRGGLFEVEFADGSTDTWYGDEIDVKAVA